MQSLTYKVTQYFSKSRVSVLLVKNHPNLGVEGEIVQVKPGHANGDLIPNKLAVFNFPGVKKRLYPNLTDYDIIQKKQQWQEQRQANKQENQNQ